MAEDIVVDNKEIFMDAEDFATWHDLNGINCISILQDISVAESLSTGAGTAQTYAGIYGSRLQVNCLTESLQEVPVFGQVFFVDQKQYLVEDCTENMGILTIQLVANDR
ncbi:MAG: hypothetical protein RSB52_08015 [Acidaminococcaceae bacterium]